MSPKIFIYYNSLNNPDKFLISNFGLKSKLSKILLFLFTQIAWKPKFPPPETSHVLALKKAISSFFILYFFTGMS